MKTTRTALAAAAGPGRSNRDGYASSEEALRMLLVDSVDLEAATRLYRKPDPVTKRTISERIRKGTVIAYRVATGEYRVPVWQFRPEGGIIEGIAETLRSLKASRTYSQITPFVFLLQENPTTGNLTPIEALKRGKLDAVLAAAREYASSVPRT